MIKKQGLGSGSAMAWLELKNWARSTSSETPDKVENTVKQRKRETQFEDWTLRHNSISTFCFSLAVLRKLFAVLQRCTAGFSYYLIYLSLSA